MAPKEERFLWFWSPEDQSAVAIDELESTTNKFESIGASPFKAPDSGGLGGEDLRRRRGRPRRHGTNDVDSGAAGGINAPIVPRQPPPPPQGDEEKKKRPVSSNASMISRPTPPPNYNDSIMEDEPMARDHSADVEDLYRRLTRIQRVTPPPPPEIPRPPQVREPSVMMDQESGISRAPSSEGARHVASLASSTSTVIRRRPRQPRRIESSVETSDARLAEAAQNFRNKFLRPSSSSESSAASALAPAQYPNRLLEIAIPQRNFKIPLPRAQPAGPPPNGDDEHLVAKIARLAGFMGVEIPVQHIQTREDELRFFQKLLDFGELFNREEDTQNLVNAIREQNRLRETENEFRPYTFNPSTGSVNFAPVVEEPAESPEPLEPEAPIETEEPLAIEAPPPPDLRVSIPRRIYDKHMETKKAVHDKHLELKTKYQKIGAMQKARQRRLARAPHDELEQFLLQRANERSTTNDRSVLLPIERAETPPPTIAVEINQPDQPPIQLAIAPAPESELLPMETALTTSIPNHYKQVAIPPAKQGVEAIRERQRRQYQRVEHPTPSPSMIASEAPPSTVVVEPSTSTSTMPPIRITITNNNGGVPNKEKPPSTSQPFIDNNENEAPPEVDDRPMNEEVENLENQLPDYIDSEEEEAYEDAMQGADTDSSADY